MHGPIVVLLSVGIAGSAAALVSRTSVAIDVPAQRAQAADTAEYRVQISGDVPLVARIVATLPVAHGQVFMATWGGADHLPRSWSTFVRDLEATTLMEEPLAIQERAVGQWLVGKGYSGRIRLTYNVDLSFATEKWPPGNEQAGYYADDALYLVTRPLFIVTDLPGVRQVSFQVPDGWEVAAPWITVGRAPPTFLATDHGDLINNSLILARHGVFQIREGPFELSLALPGPMAEHADLVVPVLQASVRQALTLFPGTEPSTYLMTFFFSDEEDGEAFFRSAAFTTDKPVTASGRPVWGNILAHELLHFWNGQRIRGVSRQRTRWFREGFSEYYASLFLVRSEVIDRELFVRKMERNLALYLLFNYVTGASLVDAGQGGGLNRSGVYNGGWSAAFCLDVMIRDASRNAATLDDLMREMYAKFGVTGELYELEDIASIAAKWLGEAATDFFRKHIAGGEVLPVEECLNRSGWEAYVIHYAGEVHIESDSLASQLQRDIREGILRGSAR